jgi:bifunctional non-homologous end joining protein LigD
LERKAALFNLLEHAGDPLVISGFIRGEGALAYKRACEAGLEGVIAKAVDSPYRGGRSDAWRKLKCIDSDEFLIVGYTTGKGSRGDLGALLLAEPMGKEWRYVGRVGTGFDEAMLKRVFSMLKPAHHKPELIDPPGAKQLRGAKPVWVKPEHVVEIAFRGRTGDGLLRQGSFKGLRPDKNPHDLRDRDRDEGEPTVTRRASKSARKSATKSPSRRAGKSSSKSTPNEIALTHPDRVLIPGPRVTKLALAEFYRDVAEHLLPGIIGRPLSLVRCPDGVGKPCFFQKHSMQGMPDSIRVGMQTSSKDEEEEYLYVDGIGGVMGLVQMNVIEIHPWGSTVADLEHPDRLVFDLDPDAGVEWSRVRDCARLLRDRLQAVGLESFLRTTGGKGLHVVVPLNPRPDWDTAKIFSHALARTLEQESPKEYVSVATKSKRKGRIFIDYLRNARGSTAVASFCVRARKGAGVATPLHWEELSRLRSGAQYTIENIARRLKTMKDDPWAHIEEVRQALPT